MAAKIIFAILLLGIGFYILTLSSEKLYPSFDLNAPGPLPKSARVLSAYYETGIPGVPSRKGLEKLHASASGQITLTSLTLMEGKLPNPKAITVVDLREESHGFVNGLPISWKLPNTTWTNNGKTVTQIEADEKARLEAIAEEGTVLLDPGIQPLKIVVGHIQTERELVESLGMHYVRIPITENHPPALEQVDRLVELFRNLPEDEWLHGHCHGGRGRATLFAAMYDILENSHLFTLEEIVMRQLLLGGTDLMNVPDDFRHEVAQVRIQFLRNFYAYSKEGTEIPYSKWINR